MSEKEGANAQCQFQEYIFEDFAAEGCFGSGVDVCEEFEELATWGCLEMVQLK